MELSHRTHAESAREMPSPRPSAGLSPPQVEFVTDRSRITSWDLPRWVPRRVSVCLETPTEPVSAHRSPDPTMRSGQDYPSVRLDPVATHYNPFIPFAIPQAVCQRADCSSYRALLPQACERQTGGSLPLLSRRGLFPRPQRDPRGWYAACRCRFHIIHICTHLHTSALYMYSVSRPRPPAAWPLCSWLEVEDELNSTPTSGPSVVGPAGCIAAIVMHAYGRTRSSRRLESRAACMYPHTPAAMESKKSDRNALQHSSML